MEIEISLEAPDALAAYASVPISYRVEEVLDTQLAPEGGRLLPYRSRRLDVPFVKDYDALPGNHPLDWAARFDVLGWGVFAARTDGERVGGVVVIPPTADVEMLDGRDDLALLWDIRVTPKVRNRGIGTALLDAATSWARARGARVLKVETQNTNVPACWFYARNGFTLRTIDADAYPELAGEVQLLWYKELA